MQPLEGKVTVITGAKGGLGSVVTEAFLAAGARVVGVSRTIRQADFQRPEFLAMALELSNADAARALASDVMGRFGRIDALVHVMGGFAGGQSVAETDDATIEQMLDLNYRAAFYVARAVLPHMRQQGSGRILAVASRQGVEPGAMVGAYSASKAALVALVRVIALENKDRGISANTVLPGTMDTPGNRAGDPNADRSKWVQPAQVAALLVHLASDAAAQITGAAIPIYGPQV
ncbi:MAG TPA: SDR family NAD(P)-dependent oxidoreductase [Bryobacteraceae bacterium]|nr:SDR family NAD(P)-dependent oxidoreductase [Bryobacteraceae bacterium]